jgi:hypothetical protein
MGRQKNGNNLKLQKKPSLLYYPMRDRYLLNLLSKVKDVHTMVTRKALLLASIVGVMALVLVASVSAQQTQCNLIGAATGGDILVDASGVRSDNLTAEEILCSVVIAPGAGTPLDGNKAIPDYTAIAGVDVWTGNFNSGFAADFELYDPPVRVCFRAADFGVSAEAAVGPTEMVAGQSGPALMFSDARHFNTIKRATDAYVGGARNFNALEIVEAGRAVGYICADLRYPGLVNLIPSVPVFDATDPAHPLYVDQPDRCLVPGAADCQD